MVACLLGGLRLNAVDFRNIWPEKKVEKILGVGYAQF
jgi:hypothetical protein